MVFSETNTRQGLIQECERICNLGTLSGNTLKDFTARINNALDRFYAIVFKYDVNWNFDDRRYADSDANFPIATTDLVSGQRDYLFDDEFLSVTQVFAKNAASGTFIELTAQDDKNAPNAYIASSSNGIPSTYELVGNSLILDPAPSYNSTGGLKVTFKRNGVKFTSTDGAIEPGIPSLFHAYLARYASYPYCVEKGLKQANALKQLILEDEAQIAQFISNRAKPKRVRLGVLNENNK